MILNEEKIKEFEEAARPVVKFLCDNCHPHVQAVIDGCSAEITEGVCRVAVEYYIEKCNHWINCPDKYNGCLGYRTSPKCSDRPRDAEVK